MDGERETEERKGFVGALGRNEGQRRGNMDLRCASWVDRGRRESEGVGGLLGRNKEKVGTKGQGVDGERERKSEC